jgi:hypothetical protein
VGVCDDEDALLAIHKHTHSRRQRGSASGDSKTAYNRVRRPVGVHIDEPQMTTCGHTLSWCFCVHFTT